MQLKDLGITPKKEAQFNKRGIFTLQDLVAYLPTGYKDFSKETGVLPDGETSCVTILTQKIRAFYGGRVPCFRVEGVLHDTGLPISVVWFNQQYLYNKLAPKMGMAFYAAGKISVDIEHRRYEMKSPELFEPAAQTARKIYPTYRKVPGMSMEYLTQKIEAALQIPEATAETLPLDVVREQGQLSRKEALYHLHTPNSQEQIEQGRDRILFDELLYFALHNEWAKKASVPVSPVMLMRTDKMLEIIANLPYTLTDDQDMILGKMLDRAKKNLRINALVQGDVGCGKTIIAILLMVAMAENGYQSVFMAPTQILARQHYEELQEITAPYGFKTAYLGSTLKKSERTKILKAIASGEVDFVVGTHSVISPAVQYRKLALVITDEEHKFGVSQRSALVGKAGEGVHTVTMSATPIPRTLAQVIYGDVLHLYTINTMPEGRKPVVTGIATGRDKIYRRIIKEAKEGHQTYVVCPLIDPTDKLEGVKAVEEVQAEYEAALTPYGVRIATLTGRDNKETTDQTVDDFRAGKVDVLIATTVVEVGVNVPTASMMVVSNAERFGLATLHQLRGRVGRSDVQSFCVLECGPGAEKSSKRLEAMCSTTNGFEIAKQDLAIRGAGDFLGTKQSGENKYMTLMMAFPNEYARAKDVAKAMLNDGAKCLMLQQVMEERAEMDNPA